MPVRETVTINFDGDAAGFLVASRAVRSELESLEREINQTNARLAKVQQDQAAVGDQIARRQQAQSEALKNSLEAQRVAYLQIGALQQSSLRHRSEEISQQTELVRLSGERLDLDQQRLEVSRQINKEVAENIGRQAEANRLSAKPFERRGETDFSGIGGSARQAEEATDRVADSTAYYKDVLNATQGEQVRLTDSTQRYKDILDGLPEDTDDVSRATERLHRALNQSDTELDPSPDVLDHLVRQLELAQEIERVGNRIVHTRERDAVLIKRFTSGLDLSSRSLRNLLDGTTKLSFNLLRVYVITGLIAALLVSFETLAGIVGIIGVAFGAFATIRYLQDLRQIRQETELSSEAAQRFVAANRGIGLSITQTGDALKAIRGGIGRGIADPLSQEATELKLLGLQFTESDLRGDKLVGTVIRLEQALAGLSATDANERIALLTKESEAAQRLLERGNLGERFETTIQLRILTGEEEERVDRIQERFGQAFGTFYSRLRGFIADNGTAISQLTNQAETFLLPIFDRITSFLSDYIKQLNENFPGIIEALENAFPHIVETLDQIVLRLEQFASVFTSFGLSGPQVVDVLAALVAVTLLAGVLAPLVVVIRSVVFLFKGLANTVRGLPAVFRSISRIGPLLSRFGATIVRLSARLLGLAVGGALGGPVGLAVAGGLVLGSVLLEHLLDIARKTEEAGTKVESSVKEGNNIERNIAETRGPQGNQVVREQAERDRLLTQGQAQPVEVVFRGQIPRPGQVEVVPLDLSGAGADIQTSRNALVAEDLQRSNNVLTEEMTELVLKLRLAGVEVRNQNEQVDNFAEAVKRIGESRLEVEQFIERIAGVELSQVLSLDDINRANTYFERTRLNIPELNRLRLDELAVGEKLRTAAREKLSDEQRLLLDSTRRDVLRFNQEKQNIQTSQGLLDLLGLSREEMDKLVVQLSDLAPKVKQGLDFDPDFLAFKAENERLNQIYSEAIGTYLQLRRREEAERVRGLAKAERDAQRQIKQIDRQAEARRLETINSLEQVAQQRLRISSFNDYIRVVGERFGKTYSEIIDLLEGALENRATLSGENLRALQQIEDFTGILTGQAVQLFQQDIEELERRADEIANRRDLAPLGGPISIDKQEANQRRLDVERRLIAAENSLAIQRERNSRLAELASSSLQSFNQTLASLITDALFDVDDKSFQERIRDYFRNLTNQILSAILTELSQPLLKQIQLFGQGPQARDPEGNFTADLLKAALPGLIQAGTSAARGAGKRTAPVVEVNQQIFGSAEPRTARAAGRVGAREGLREALATQGGRELVSQAIEEETD